MSYQQIMLLGNIGGDANLQYTQQGRAVASFSLAVNREWKDNTGAKQHETTWFRVSVWAAQAEALHQYLLKGQQVLVIGRSVKARAYTGKDGNTAVSLEVTAETIRLLGGRGERQEQSQSEDELQDIPF